MNTVNDLFERAPLCDLAGIQTMVVGDLGRSFANRGDVRLTSCFQPIFSLTHGRAAGFEAMLRVRDADGNALEPHAMFDMTQDHHESLLLDRLSCTVHVDNFLKQINAEGWLFIKMNPRAFIESVGEDPFFEDLLTRYGLPAARMVIELSTDRDTELPGLAVAMAAWRAKGSLVAFDDFNADATDLDRVWSLRPDIVKVNRRLTQWAVTDDKTRRDLATAIRDLHDMGSLALLQGVETQEQVELALELQADLVEGYFLGRPTFEIPAAAELRAVCTRYSSAFRARSLRALNMHRDRIAAYVSGLWSASILLESDLGLAQSVKGLMALPAALFCYLVDAEGNQVGERVADVSQRREHPEFAHLASSAGANFAHQRSFRNAWARPGHIQVSEPGFGILARVPSMCLSITVQIGSVVQVLCLEVDAGILRAG